MAKIHEHLRKHGRPAPHPAGMVEQAPGVSEPVFKGRLRAHFFVRLHMLLIFGAVILSGVSVSKLLLEFSVVSMPVRYAIAVCIAYGVFFLLVRLWLWYVGITGTKSRQRKQSSSNSSSGDSSSGLDINVDFSSGGGSKGSSWSGFGGGKSGGGGASDSWGQPAFLSSDQSFSSGGSGSSWFSGGSSKSSSFGLDDIGLDGGDDGCLGVIVLLLLAALLLAIFGAGIYAIYQAPAILAEAAFQAALASGLIRATKRIERGDWAGSVFKATIIPLVIVLALAVAFGWAAHRYCPAATRVAEIFRLCR
ncbi:MAG: hypothetical protein AB7U82_17110 [Blastocatellales bacterium]